MSYVHFGPGVPMPPATDRATAIWRAEELPAHDEQDSALVRRQRNQRWILPLTVLILIVAVLIYYVWGRGSSAVAVSSVSVRGSSASVGCGGTERLTAVLSTNGGGGDVTYQWVRSDGTKSDPLQQAVDRGTRRVTVTLDWNFQGFGAMNATATLRVLSPGTSAASTSFGYNCPRP